MTNLTNANDDEKDAEERFNNHHIAKFSFKLIFY